MLLIKNGRIKTMRGEDIARGFVLIGEDGKIAEIGSGEYSGAACEEIDVEGRLVTPGLIDAHCHIGYAGGPGSGVNESTDPITPHLRAIDAIDPTDERIGNAMRGGVTTVCVGPGSLNVVGGTFAAIKTAGIRVDDMIVKYPVAMKCAFGENPSKGYGEDQKKTPRTRMAVAAMLRELLFKSRNYLLAKESGKEPTFDMKLEAMLPVMKKELPLKAHAHTANDIFTAIRIAKEFDLRLTLDHCTDGALIADELKKEGYPALVGPSFGGKSKKELDHKSFQTPAALYKAGVKIGIITDAGVTPIESLPMFAGMAIAEGLPYDAAWEAVTISPAEILEIDGRVGSLECGKDADVVVWTEDPLTTVGAKALVTVISGKIVHKLS